MLGALPPKKKIMFGAILLVSQVNFQFMLGAFPPKKKIIMFGAARLASQLG